ncbi:hypothetical protein HRbin36_00922 [bacterium HR36]|nr:hypothetical protein HRbin36_00922 [bacterium HR36]
MRIFALVAATVLTACTFLPAQEKPDASGAAKLEGENLLLLTDERPLLLRLHVMWNGQPIAERWRQAVDKLFAFADRNQDGRLSRDELLRLRTHLTGARLGGTLPFDLDAQGTISREAFQHWLRQINLGPIQISVLPGELHRPEDLMPGLQEPVLSRALFVRLDANGDGKLDAREIEQAQRRLQALDEDEDELVTPLEIVRGYQETSAKPGAGAARGPGEFRPRLLILNNATAESQAIFYLQVDYSTEFHLPIRFRRLAANDIHLPRELFQRLDKNGDGWLDEEELRGFLRRPPDVEVTLHLQEAGRERPSVRFAEATARFGCQVMRTDDEVVLELSKTRLRLSAHSWLLAGNAYRAPSRLANSAQTLDEFLAMAIKNYLPLFMRADTDHNGYLDEQEFRRISMGAVLVLQGVSFAELDGDGDGKIFQEEFAAFLRQVFRVQLLAHDVGLSLALTHRGSELFRLLDTNRDGKLGLREWRQAPNILRNLDRNGDSVLEWNDLTAHWQLDIGPRSPTLPLPYSGRMMLSPQNPFSRPDSAQANIPAWFRAMDRNGDGDIPRREFPGTDKEFRRLDADGDGLISLQEALVAIKDTSVPLPPQPQRKP